MKRLVLVLIATVLAVTGCSGSPTPSPTPIMCTPVLGGTPYECDKLDHDALKLQTAEYEEAENVYRRFIEEDIKQQASDRPIITPTLEETTTPEFRKSMREAYSEYESKKVKIISGETRLVYIKRVPKDVIDGATRFLESCIDGSSLRSRENNGPLIKGTALKSNIYFKRDAGNLRIAGMIYEELKKC